MATLFIEKNIFRDDIVEENICLGNRQIDNIYCSENISGEREHLFVTIFLMKRFGKILFVFEVLRRIFVVKKGMRKLFPYEDIYCNEWTRDNNWFWQDMLW